MYGPLVSASGSTRACDHPRGRRAGSRARGGARRNARRARAASPSTRTRSFSKSTRLPTLPSSRLAHRSCIMTDEPRSPLELLEALAVQEVEITPDLHHLEIYTMRGLLTLLWHGPRDATNVVSRAAAGWAACSGRPTASTTTSATCFAAPGIGTVRVGYRKPNDLVALRARRRRRGRPREPFRRAPVRHDRPLVRRRGRVAGRRDPRRALPRCRHARDAVGRLRARRPTRRHSAAAVPRHRRRDPAARDERRGADARRARRGRDAAGHGTPAHAVAGRTARAAARSGSPRAST